MNKPWLAHYEKGVPEEIDQNRFPSLAALIEESLVEHSNKPAFTCMGKTLSYRELNQLSASFGAYLTTGLGLKKGDRVALMMPNILQYPVALFGILRSGLIAVNVNPLYTARELKHQLNDSGAKTIVIVENFAHVLSEVIRETSVENVVVTSMGELLGFPKSMVVDFILRRVKKLVPPYSFPNSIRFMAAISQGREMDFHPHSVAKSDVALLQYTGGTTGLSKGAMLTHSNLLANVQQAKAWISPHLSSNAEVIITALPLYHIFSLTANCFTFVHLGAENILIPNPRDIGGFIKEMKKHRFTAFTGVNTMFNALMNHPDFTSIDFSSFRLCLGGGMAVQKAVAERWKKLTGVTLSQAYGLTETSPAAVINPLGLKEFNGSIGVPISSTLVEIRDEAGKTVPNGEPGELCIKGPQVMLGYWNRPDETAKVLTGDGWLRTGDIAVISDDGYVTIVDRKKDMIIVSGFNVYPNEIEDILAMDQRLLESAVVGVPDEKSGEAVKVFAIKKDPAVTEKDVIAHCRKYLTGYKVPKYVEFRKELPKTNVGKILRRALKEA